MKNKVSINQVKKLREKTGLSVAECKRALEDAGGDMKKALEFLKKRGVEVAAKKAERETGAGVVESYTHHTLTSGATVVVQSETDFVARNPEFREFAHHLAQQVTATNPRDVAQLLQQPDIRDETKTIKDLLNENIAKFGENLKIKEFKRFEV